MSETFAFAHHTIALDDVRLHYVSAGSGDPVVLLHGWPQTWFEWRRIIPALASRYTVIAPDMRGLGDSSRPVTGYDKRTVAHDIYQLVHKLGFQQVYLVGHDWGGPVAYAYACAHPAEVRKLVILDVTIPGEAWEKFPQITRRGGVWHLAFHSVRDLPEALVVGRERTYLSWFYRSLVYNPSAITEEDIDEYERCYAAPARCAQGSSIIAQSSPILITTRKTLKPSSRCRCWRLAVNAVSVTPRCTRCASSPKMCAVVWSSGRVTGSRKNARTI